MGKNYMPEVAKMLGVEIGEPFDVFDEDGEIKWCGPYRFTDETIVNCDDEGAPIWLLHYLLCGEYTLQKRPWRPKEGEGYYYIRSTDGFLSRSTFHSVDADDLALLNMGNCFPSEEAALAKKDEMLAKFEEIKKGGAGVMDAIEFLEQKRRMTGDCITTCDTCPLALKNNDKNVICVDFEKYYIRETVAAVENWAKEHPKKTYKGAFLEKFPDAKEIDGVPAVCVASVFGEETRVKSCSDSLSCFDCWNREMRE